jgi:hypothetical protein
LNLVLAMAGITNRPLACRPVRQQLTVNAFLKLLGLPAVAHAAGLDGGAAKAGRARQFDLMGVAVANMAVRRRLVAALPFLPMHT